MMRSSHRHRRTVAATLALVVAFAVPASAATHRTTLPNGCMIEGMNSWYPQENLAYASSREISSCEKINVSMKWFDSNWNVWVVGTLAYTSNSFVGMSRVTTVGFDYSDHNGRANGTDWGFRLNGNL